MSFNYGLCKAVDILLDLKIKDEEIKNALMKHFNIRYSEAEKVLNEAKEYHKSKKVRFRLVTLIGKDEEPDFRVRVP